MADVDSIQPPAAHERVWQEHKRVYAALGVVSLALERLTLKSNDDEVLGAMEAATALLSAASDNLCQLSTDLQE